MPVPPALTPALALDYVRELSADVRAVLLLGTDGELVAGPEPLRADAVALLAAAGSAAELEAVTSDAVVCAVRSGGRSMVAVCGRFAIPAVVRIDLRAALAAVEARAVDSLEPVAQAPAGEAAERALEGAAERLISAAQRRFGT
jgi:hypothetical protein